MTIKDDESIDLSTQAGPMRTYVLRPVAEGRYPGIVLFSEIFQVTGPIRRTAALLAGHGFVVTVPEIFHELEQPGTVLPYDQAGADRGNVDKITKELSSYDADARVALNYLQSHPQCTGKLGVMGFCIGGPFIWSLLKRAPNRIAAAVVAQPVGWRPEMRDRKYQGAFWANWGATLIAKRPEISLQTTDQFVTRMFETNPDFVFTVTRDFVRGCQNPVLIMPDDVPAHPYAVAMECAMLAHKAEVSMFPWKEPKERIPLAVRQIHSFLRAHRPA